MAQEVDKAFIVLATRYSSNQQADYEMVHLDSLSSQNLPYCYHLGAGKTHCHCVIEGIKPWTNKYLALYENVALKNERVLLLQFIIPHSLKSFMLKTMRYST